MSSNAKALTFFAGVLLLYSSASAVTPDNPYFTILDRNPFGLNPPALAPTNVPPPPPRNVKFNGITYVGGRKKAFFTIPSKDAKGPPEYVTLAENESSDDLEVTAIRKEEGEVEVVNSGTKMVLNFKENGNKGVSVTSAVAATAPTPVPVAVTPSSPVYMPTGNNPVVAGAAGYNIPGQTTSFQQNSPLSNPTVYNGVVAASQMSGHAPASNVQPASIDPVQQRMNMLAQHAMATQAYENGETITVYQPQKDPKIFSPGGVPHKRYVPPPPPLPPGVSSGTAE